MDKTKAKNRKQPFGKKEELLPFPTIKRNPNARHWDCVQNHTLFELVSKPKGFIFSKMALAN